MPSTVSNEEEAEVVSVVRLPEEEEGRKMVVARRITPPPTAALSLLVPALFDLRLFLLELPEKILRNPPDGTEDEESRPGGALAESISSKDRLCPGMSLSL
jgi:hypothetical protein